MHFVMAKENDEIRSPLLAFFSLKPGVFTSEWTSASVTTKKCAKLTQIIHKNPNPNVSDAKLRIYVPNFSV